MKKRNIATPRAGQKLIFASYNLLAKGVWVLGQKIRIWWIISSVKKLKRSIHFAPDGSFGVSTSLNETKWFSFFLLCACKSCRTTERKHDCQTYEAFPPLILHCCSGKLSANGPSQRTFSGNPNSIPRGFMGKPTPGSVLCVWCGTASGRRGNAVIYTFISYSHLWF